MGYRQNNSTNLKAWLRRNRAALLALGFPADIASDDQRFLLAMQNGEDEETGWQGTGLADESVAGLLALLTDLFEGAGWQLMDDLRKRLWR